MHDYQRNVLVNMLSHVDVAHGDVLEIGGAPPFDVATEFVRRGASSVTTINSRPDLIDRSIGEGVEFRNVDARSIASVFRGRRFRLIFGIAVLEHLPDIDLILQQCAQILEPQGAVAFHGAAFWSGALGHHVFVHADGQRYEFNGNNPIDDFSHLYLAKREMLEQLTVGKQIPVDHAEKIVDYIYDDSVLNRWNQEDIVGAFSRQNFQLDRVIQVDWRAPSSEVVGLIAKARGPVLSAIYRNHSCGEMLIVARTRTG